MLVVELFIILLVVLFVPFLVKRVEEDLEIFLFIIGCAAITITSQWSAHLVTDALTEPVRITLAVFIAGVIFRFFQKPIGRSVNRIADTIGVKSFAFLVIMTLGFLSSAITAIVAALVLVEMVTHLMLDRKNEIILVVLACFSIGMGAALTPIGEPLSTIVVAKLRQDPYHAGFFFLFGHLWRYVVPGVMIFGLLGAILIPAKRQKRHGLKEDRKENFKDICVRAGKVYLFVMALIFLGQGFKPVIDTFILKIPYQGLYWLNMISAIVDNATLAAAEITPNMGILQIKSTVLGLMIAGGMLIPGNIPNIIAAGKLKIKSSEWARFGVPVGLTAMAIYFLLVCINI